MSMTRLTRNRTTGAGVNMVGWRNIGFAAQHCLDGLIDEENLIFFVKVVRTTAKIFSPLKPSDVPGLQKDIRAIIKKGNTVIGPSWNRPNTHGYHTHVNNLNYTIPSLVLFKFTYMNCKCCHARICTHTHQAFSAISRSCYLLSCARSHTRTLELCHISRAAGVGSAHDSCVA